jgi:phage terminase large subunit GpA-like protein
MAVLSLEAAEQHAAEAEQGVLGRFRPEPVLSRRDWGERYRRVGESGSLPLDFSRTPYLIEILDSLDDPLTEEVSIMKCTQAGATDAVFLTMVGYHIDQDPCAMMIILPSIEEAQKWSTTKLQPMLEREPLLGKVSDPRSRDGTNTKQEKEFPGGRLGLVGSNSGRGFRMVPVRIVGGDDVDGWAPSAGPEGDQITLARRRADRSPNRQYVWVSTPTVKGASRIERLYNAMERRGRYHVPCPHCGEYQVLRWGSKETNYGIKWLRGDPSTAFYLCAVNGCVFYDRDKHAIVPEGKYLTEDGEPVRDGKASKLGFWFNALTILLPGAEWPKLVEEYRTAHRDPVTLRAFTNTILAETYEEKNREISTLGLENRRENWREPAKPGDAEVDVPHGVGLLSLAVDVQETWVEAAVWGWGADEQCWLIYHERIQGDPEDAETFGRVEAIRVRTWRHASGRDFYIWPAAIDARHLPHEVVYPYVLGKEEAGVYAMVGYDRRARQVLQRAERPNKYRVRPWTVSVDAFKDVLFARLGIAKPGPGYIHFPAPFPMGADANFLKQFGAERRKTVLERGRVVRCYEQLERRNEAIDLYCLGLEALHALGPTVIGSLAERATEWSKPPEKPAPAKVEAPVARGGSWATRF